MHLELLGMGASSIQEATSEVQAQLDQLQKIINETRKLVALDLSLEATPLEISEIGSLLQRAEKLFEGIELNIPENSLAGVMLPPVHLEAILHALIHNAQEAGANRFSIVPREGYLFAEDNGTPFTDVAILKALTPYYSSKEGSVGLGLNISLYLLESYRGGLAIQSSSSEKKACIKLTLPR